MLSVYQGTEAPGIFLQVTYLVECLAPRHLHIDRYLGITPITLWLNHTGEVIASPDLSAGKISPTPDTDDILGNSGIKRLVKKMLKSAENHVYGLTQEMVDESRISVEQELQSEISRLQMLARLNPSVDQSEIKNLQTHQRSLFKNIGGRAPLSAGVDSNGGEFQISQGYRLFRGLWKKIESVCALYPLATKENRGLQCHLGRI